MKATFVLHCDDTDGTRPNFPLRLTEVTEVQALPSGDTVAPTRPENRDPRPDRSGRKTKARFTGPVTRASQFGLATWLHTLHTTICMPLSATQILLTAAVTSPGTEADAARRPDADGNQR